MKAGSRIDKAKQLHRLAIIERMSLIMHKARRLDQYEAPSDIDYMGTNWTRIYENSDFTENEVTAARFLTQLNELVPSLIMSLLDEAE